MMADKNPSSCHGHTCDCKMGVAVQSLDEMEFERGIWSAALHGEMERVRKLVESGKAEVDQRDSAGYTALHYAARSGHLDICEYLLQRGACVNATTRAGKATALHRACSTGKSEVIKLLLSAGADINLPDADGKSALDRAIENKHEDCLVDKKENKH